MGNSRGGFIIRGVLLLLSAMHARRPAPCTISHRMCMCLTDDSPAPHQAVSKTGGHLGSSLGVIELTVALHHVFDAPEDKIIFDVSHQVYPHKILTGRRDRMHSLRQSGGISGFAKRAESEYDCFGAGHSSTSISAALGMSVGKSLTGKRRNNCIAIIGDGAITGGMAFEAMNTAGYLNQRSLVILNDNGQVSLPTGTHSAGGIVPAGALSSYTGRLLMSQNFQTVRDVAKKFNRLMPTGIQDINKKIDEYARGELFFPPVSPGAS